MVVLFVSAWASLAAPQAPAQEIPDFSGKWTAVLDVRSGRDVLALGETFSVTQLDTILLLEAAGSKRTLIIDGMPHEHRLAPQPAPALPARGNTVVQATTTRATSTAAWQDVALKIVTVELVTVLQRNRTPDKFDSTRTTTLTWRLLPDGLLSVERTVRAEPSISGRQTPPSTVKTTYSRDRR